MGFFSISTSNIDFQKWNSQRRNCCAAIDPPGSRMTKLDSDSEHTRVSIVMYPPPHDVSDHSAASSSSIVDPPVARSSKVLDLLAAAPSSIVDPAVRSASFFSQLAASRPIVDPPVARNTEFSDQSTASSSIVDRATRNARLRQLMASRPIIDPPVVRNTTNYAHYFRNLESSEYYCKTSGSHSGVVPACNWPGPLIPVDYHHEILLWDDGFTVNGDNFRRFDDPRNHDFLRAIMNSQLPQELQLRAETKLHRLTIRKNKPTLIPVRSLLPPRQILSFKKGTPIEEIAAAADPPNSYLMELDSDSEQTRYMLYQGSPDVFWI